MDSWDQWSCVLEGPDPSTERGTFGVILGHTRTCPQLILSTLFARGSSDAASGYRSTLATSCCCCCCCTLWQSNLTCAGESITGVTCNTRAFAAAVVCIRARGQWAAAAVVIGTPVSVCNRKQGNGALQAPPPPPLARWTRLVSAPAVQPSSRARRNQYDAAGGLACARRRNDVTSSNAIDRHATTRSFTCKYDVIRKTGST